MSLRTPLLTDVPGAAGRCTTQSRSRSCNCQLRGLLRAASGLRHHRAGPKFECGHPRLVYSNTDLSLDQGHTALAVVDSSSLADEPSGFAGAWAFLNRDLDESKLDECAAAVADVGRPEPRSYSEAVAGDDAPGWVRAIESEISSHTKNGTFGKPITKCELRRKGFRSVPLGDVWKVKRCGRKKYRIVVRGYLLRAGIEFNETFAPVAYLTTIRLLLALATKYDWEVKQGDVGTAFLCSDMDTEVYVTMPRAVLAHNDRAAAAAAEGRTVYRLLKGVPGIPQASRLFSKKIHGVLANAGFTRSEVDHALYIAAGNIHLVIWTDDMFLFFPTDQAAAAGRMWRAMQAELDLGAWGDIGDCLGCTIQRDRPNRTTTLTQTQPIKNLIARAGLATANSVDTPCATGFIFTKADCPQTEEDKMSSLLTSRKHTDPS